MPAPFRFSASITQFDIAEMGAAAARAEELGYATVSVSDHLDAQPAPLIALTAAAAATSQVKLLPLVLANDYRNPLVLAKELATLDAMSGGRVEFGIGAGWMKTDYEAAGFVYDTPGVRIRRLSESVDAIRDLLDGKDLDHDGEFYSIKGPLSEPLPRSKRVPLMLAGGKPKMLGLAGEKADIVGINPELSAGVIDAGTGKDATADRTDAKISWIKEGAGSRFDDIELQTRVHLTMISSDRQGVAEQMAPLLGLSADQALNSPHALVGTVAECIDTVKSWRERWGISYIALNGDQMEEFAPVVEALSGT